MSTQIVVRTEEQDQDFALSVALKSIEIYKEREGLNIKDNQRRILENLISERFPDYTGRYRLDKIKKAIRAGEVGSIDRYGNLTASYLELKKYLFNK